jgi:hypothetical protein
MAPDGFAVMLIQYLRRGTDDKLKSGDVCPYARFR